MSEEMISPRVHRCRECRTPFDTPEYRRWCDDCNEKRRALWEKLGRGRTHCAICQDPIEPYGSRKYCEPCAGSPALKRDRRQRYKAKNDNEKARLITKYAVRVGFLPDPRNYICMDCNRYQAECYDHRDYSKPLQVDAVCLACNSSRGRGIPFHAPLKLVSSN